MEEPQSELQQEELPLEEENTEMYEDSTDDQAGGEEPSYIDQPEEPRDAKKWSWPRFGQVGFKTSFIDGLLVGLGIGCIATFIVMWITVYFTPQMPSAITYENMLAIFIYPLLYLLVLGLVALTAGTVREYYSERNKT